MPTLNSNSTELQPRWNSVAVYLLLVAATATGWILYQRLLVPVLEGPSTLVQAPTAPPQLDLSLSSFDRQELGSLLPVDAWERDQSKLVVSDQGIIMFREFIQVQDGYLEVIPFTMVIKGSTNTDGDAPVEQASKTAPLILRCLKGARLKFKGDNVDPFSGKAKLESARLIGQVDIYRPASSDIADDAIEVTTSNVHINELQVYTMEEVQFAFGPHRGLGRQLLIDLQVSQNAKPRQPLGLSDVDGIRRLELADLTQLELLRQPDKKRIPALTQLVAAETASASPDSDQDQQDVPQIVRVTCQGPFVLDFDRRTASFSDHVLVQADGEAPEQLSCHRLTILFESLRNGDSPWESLPTAVPGSRTPPISSTTTAADSKWDMRRLVAEGTPAILTSHQHAARISSNLISYDLLKEEVFARSEPPASASMLGVNHLGVNHLGADPSRANHLDVVTIVTADFQLKAHQIAYRMAPEGRLGQIIALGSGSLLKLASDDQREFFLQWMEMLSLEPDGDQHLITIKNGCKMRFDEDNHFQADHLRLWLEEASVNPTQQDSSPTTRPSYQPSRLVAVNQVHIETPQLQGTTNQLTAFWRPSPIPLQLEQQLGRYDRWSPKMGDRSSRFQPTNIASKEVQTGTNRWHYAKPVWPKMPDEMTRNQWQVLPPSVNAHSMDTPSADFAGANSSDLDSPRVYRAQFNLVENSDDRNRQLNPAQHSVAMVADQEPTQGTFDNILTSDEDGSSNQRFVFRGDEVELQLLFEGSLNQLDSMAILGNVHLFQQQAKAKPDSTSQPAAGLEIEAHFLQAFPQPDQRYRMFISGQDNQAAIARTDQLTLSGNNIQFDQTANKLWIEGSGKLMLKPAANSSSDLAAASPPRLAANFADNPGSGQSAIIDVQQVASDYQDLNITWSGGMVFDGQKAYFEDEVRLLAQGTNTQRQQLQTSAHGQGMSIEFTRAISFGNAPPNNVFADDHHRSTSPEIKEIIIVNRVAEHQRVFDFKANRDLNTTSSFSSLELASIQHQTYDASGRLVDNQRFHAAQVTVNAITGLVNAKGPGWMSQQRIEIGAQDDPVAPGSTTGGLSSTGSALVNKNAISNQNRNQNRNNGFFNQTKSNGEISFVRVNFEGAVAANTLEKRFDVQGAVRTLYTSASKFETMFDPDEKSSLPADAVTIKSDRLNYAQWQPRNANQSMHELQASGNVHVVSGTFEATADRLSYQQQTEMLIIEGTARSDAQLWHQTSPNSRDRRHLTAEKILYRVTDGQTTIPNIKNIDIID